jgi:hypothetical protein
VSLPFATPITIDASLSADECLRRLDEATIRAIFTSRATHPVAGNVRGHQVTLRWRTFYSNSFQRLLRLSAQPGPMGCRLSGEFSMHRFTYIFYAVCFGFLFVFSIVWTIDLLRGQVEHTGGASDWLDYMPYLMIFFGYVFVRFGLWLSARTESKLLQFVVRTIEGRVVEG